MLRVAGEKPARRAVAQLQQPPHLGWPAGLGVTSLVQSSTATCLIVASFVGKGLVPPPARRSP